MAVALKFFVLAFSAKVLAYPLCESRLSKYCNDTKRINYNNALFVWNQSANTVKTSYFIAHGIVLILIMLPSVLGNGALIATVIVEKRFRTPTNHLIVSQCTADLSMTLIVQLLSLVAILHRGWDLAPQWCMIQVIFMRIFQYATVLHLTLLAIDRYIVIVKSNRKDRFTQKQVFYACGILWLIATILALPWDVFLFPTSTWFEVTTTFCYARYTKSEDGKWFILVIARVILLLIIPGLVMIFCYYHILGMLRTNRRKVGPSTISNWRKIAVAVYAKSAYTSLAVLCSFCICLLPFLIGFGLSLIGNVVSYETMSAFRMILFANTVVKPLIYITRSVAWSKKLRRLFTKRKKSKRKTVDSPSTKRLSRYIVGDSHGNRAASMNSKLSNSHCVKHFSTHDFHELFSVSGTKQAWKKCTDE